MLDGIASGPTLNESSKRLSLPSTRLEMDTRMHEFALGPPASAATTETPIAYSSEITSPPPTGSLLACARKFLQARQRDPGASDLDSDLDEDLLEEREQCEAGKEEHSVSNTFSLDVSFLRGLEVDEFSLARPVGADRRGLADELQRAVTIHLIIRPFDPNDGSPVYPTYVFPSRWNCVLDLATSSSTRQQKRESAVLEDDDNRRCFVVPGLRRPADLLPLSPCRQTPFHEYAPTVRASLLESDAPWADTHIPDRASYISPSVAFQASFPRSLITRPADESASASPAHIPLVGFTHSQTDSASTINEFLDPPTTRSPAYRAYPKSPGGVVPPTLFWQTPFALQSGPGTVGPSVKIRRERGGSLPQTPAPTVGGFAAFTGMDTMRVLKQQQEQPLDPNSSSHDAGGESIIVSVRLLPAPHHRDRAQREEDGVAPRDQFTLAIFVLNSSWTRRFKCAMWTSEARRKAKKEREAGGKGDVRPPGIIPLENRVRIGPSEWISSRSRWGFVRSTS
ncbi:hypothetical protein K466DRAFT_606181 [Polyporus arcularius HHB13444]|uniref:Uncharacterized protein n=1 Tax=Polyporus arcularius HHB13444 TaxID=1314778 RepID=A0A5C3NRL1_9APHY|nr:hypothetical protein K466DRAFT_606181 [Polyporus arcularius HHB13444]